MPVVSFLSPSLFLDSSVNPDEYINDMLKWKKDLQYPKSLGSEVRRWKGLWMNIMVSGNAKQKSEIPKTLLEALGACDKDSFPNIHFLLVLAAHDLYQVQIFLLNEKDPRHTQDQ